MRFSLRYLLATLALFAVEVCIALYVHDGFVRPFVGDVLVVMLIYCAVQTVWGAPRLATALAVFAFACAIELGQAFQLAARLNVAHDPVLRTALGTQFDPLDILAYALGTALMLLATSASRS
ncbi:MAG TPA: DUF2809 domain-containing protein [Polyangiales bacterium]|nr:DUF2809 domain-containing protein [Polyangiales bacterium]